MSFVKVKVEYKDEIQAEDESNLLSIFVAVPCK